MLKIIEFRWRSNKEKLKRRSGRMHLMLQNEEQQQFRIFKQRSNCKDKLKKKELKYKRSWRSDVKKPRQLILRLCHSKNSKSKDNSTLNSNDSKLLPKSHPDLQLKWLQELEISLELLITQTRVSTTIQLSNMGIFLQQILLKQAFKKLIKKLIRRNQDNKKSKSNNRSKNKKLKKDLRRL